LLETRKKEIEALLAAPDLYKNVDETKLISAEYKEVQVQIEKAYTHWSETVHRLDQTEKNV